MEAGEAGVKEVAGAKESLEGLTNEEEEAIGMKRVKRAEEKWLERKRVKRKKTLAAAQVSSTNTEYVELCGVVQKQPPYVAQSSNIYSPTAFSFKHAQTLRRLGVSLDTLFHPLA